MSSLRKEGFMAVVIQKFQTKKHNLLFHSLTENTGREKEKRVILFRKPQLQEQYLLEFLVDQQSKALFISTEGRPQPWKPGENCQRQFIDHSLHLHLFGVFFWKPSTFIDHFQIDICKSAVCTILFCLWNWCSGVKREDTIALENRKDWMF